MTSENETIIERTQEARPPKKAVQAKKRPIKSRPKKRVKESQSSTTAIEENRSPEESGEHTVDKEVQELIKPVEELVVQRIDATTIMIEGKKFEIVQNYRDAFDAERLGERYSEILDKYDYVVADWGFEQMRLKGFYDNRNRKVPQDQRIANLQDYLYEYCNFGCPYFVLQRVDDKKERIKTSKPKRRRTQKSKSPTNEKVVKQAQPKNLYSKQSTTINPKKSSDRVKAKKDFVKKEISPVEKSVEKNIPKETVETVKDAKGKRQYSIRRKVVPK
ncbi:MAG: YutD family protein [Carnobacterium sp.]|uniref:YutD family protein n=1 Tax=Carnobacterium sp. TaxID=48221 RepID=UPI003314849A